jgi:hypothetical protein
MADVGDALDALAVLADDERMKVAAAVVLGSGTTDEVVAATGLTKRRALEALTRLEAVGLVTHRGAQWTFDVGRLKEIAREARTRDEPDDVGDVDRETASVLRTFLRGGRLTQIPMQHSKRLVILDHICRVFDIGVRYPEREVNAYLRAFHPDTAALRRYLVDEGFLTREHNVYWRTGGSVDL